MTGQDSGYHAVKRRHPDIPQDPLPITVPAAITSRSPEPKQRGPRSIRQANCPHCLNDKPVGVILSPAGVEVLRHHNKVMHKGRRVPCAGSGRAAPE